MADLGLVIDPVTEDAASSPLTLVDRANGLAMFSFDAPTPEIESQWAYSADSEGETRGGYRYRNRQITAGIRVMEPTDAAATNLITNPSFETGTTSWLTSGFFAGVGTVTLTRVTTDPFVGSYALQAVTNGGSNAATGITFGAATNGQAYSATVRVRVSTGTATIQLILGEQGGTSSSTTATIGTSWTEITLTRTAASTGTRELDIQVNGTTVTTFFVDAVAAVVGSTPPVFFDGDTPGCSWTGTRHGSSSTRPAPGGDRFNAILNDLQAKVAKLTREGGTLQLTYPNGDIITCDVIEATLPSIPFDQHVLNADLARVPLVFTCKPFGRGVSVTLSDHVETTLPVLVFTETGIKGDVPGTVEIVIDNDSASLQQTVLWGLRSRYYDSAATAAVFLQAESLTPDGGAAAAVGTATASGGGSNVVKQTTLGTTPASMLTAGSQTHIGSYRVFARMLAPATNSGIVSVAFRWIAAMFEPTMNDTVTLDSANEGLWQLVDLGQITIPRMTVGTHGWNGSLYASSTVGADDLEVDWLLLLPVDEGWGQVVGASGSEALVAGRSLHIASDKVVSQAAATGHWRRAHKYEGDYPLLPPSGREGRTVQLVIKTAQGVMTNGVALDGGIDDISARLTYVPRYLVVPKP